MVSYPLHGDLPRFTLPLMGSQESNPGSVTSRPACSQHILSSTHNCTHIDHTQEPQPLRTTDKKVPMKKMEGQGVFQGSWFLSHLKSGIRRSELSEPAATASRATELVSCSPRSLAAPLALRLSPACCRKRAHHGPPLPGPPGPAPWPPLPSVAWLPETQAPDRALPAAREQMCVQLSPKASLLRNPAMGGR